MDPTNEGTPSTGIRELALLKALKGKPNIIKLLYTEHTEDMLLLVFELCKQDLKKFMDSFKTAQQLQSGGFSYSPLPQAVVKDLTFQMMTGMKSMHEARIIHRDLKPQNLLLTQDGVLKIADFGLARLIGTPVATYSNEVVTLWYRAPDVLMGSRNYGAAIDIWACGCILAEMYLGVPIFRGKEVSEQVHSIIKILGTPSKEVIDKIFKDSIIVEPKPIFPQYEPMLLSSLLRTAPPEGIDLLQKMLMIDPTKRLTAAECLQHPYFDGMQPR
ncbi:kinase-like protein [Clavulina sp. PMI_390]|nr:kinase-like protein [Clavulina sp. PMI_390]